MILFWIVVTIGLATFWVYLSFLALCMAKKLLNSGIELPKDLKFVCHLALIIGYPADIVYNFTRGYLMFKEFKGLTFSSRIKSYWKSNWDCPRPGLAVRWFKILEGGDPGHIVGRGALG